MKLRTNSDHQSGSFKKNLYKTVLVITTELTIFATLFPGLVSLSENLSAYKYSTSSSSKLLSSWYDDDHVIKDEKYFEINEEDLSKKKNIVIDGIMNQDLSFLEEADSMETLVIYNAQDLMDYEIEIIANSPCKNVRLSFGTFEDIMRVSPKEIDLSLLGDKNIDIFLDNAQNNELYNYLVLSMFTEYRESWFETKIHFKLYEMINEKLDKMVEELEEEGFDSLNSRDQYIAITNKVSKLIEYDPEVSNECRTNGTDIKDKKVKEKVRVYNECLLSTALLGDKEESYGVCSNYAAVAAALCNRLGIKCFYASDSSHAWNVIELDDEYYVIDMTAIDNYYDDYRNNESANPETEEKLEENIETKTFVEKEDYYKTHDADINVDYMIEDPVVDVNLKKEDSIALLVKKRILPVSITKSQIISSEFFALAGGMITALLIVVPKSSKKKRRKSARYTDDTDMYFDPDYHK